MLSACLSRLMHVLVCVQKAAILVGILVAVRLAKWKTMNQKKNVCRKTIINFFFVHCCCWLHFCARIICSLVLCVVKHVINDWFMLTAVAIKYIYSSAFEGNRCSYMIKGLCESKHVLARMAPFISIFTWRKGTWEKTHMVRTKQITIINMYVYKLMYW